LTEGATSSVPWYAYGSAAMAFILLGKVLADSANKALAEYHHEEDEHFKGLH